MQDAMPAFFVTGTDTGVGKTLVTAAILAAAKRRGLRVSALKPAETGCQTDPLGELAPSDARFLATALGFPANESVPCVYRFELPAAPAVAARHAGQTISFAEISRVFRRERARHPDLLLVEGAGGLLVPFTERETAADLAMLLELPLVVVARPGLGTINHCALTIECARHRGLDVAGFLFSHAQRETTKDPTIRTNAAEIARLTGAPFLGTLGHQVERSADALAHAAERDLDIDALFADRYRDAPSS